jgi:mannose-6-phosphate isomerase-like protein (cupin superfamily)
MKVIRTRELEPIVPPDGSEVREIARPPDTARNQSLAEARVPPGGETAEHFHRASEEIYHFVSGKGRMRLGDQESEVGPGETVLIPPGTRPSFRTRAASPWSSSAARRHRITTRTQSSPSSRGT